MNPKPILILSDAITSPTGLGRISRELAIRIHEHLPEFRVATAGIGGGYSSKFGFPNYPIARLDNWAPPEMPHIWKDFAGTQEGIVFAIWNASWLPWLANPSLLPQSDLKKFLMSGIVERWGYFPIDGCGFGGKLPESQGKIFAGFDRILAYTEFGAEVIDRTREKFPNRKHKKRCEWLPHGIDTSVFHPRDKKEARRTFVERVTGGAQSGRIDGDVVLLAVVATNTRRKDWFLAFETCAKLMERDIDVGLWAHTDSFEKEWDLPGLAEAFGMKNRVIFSNIDLSDENMAWAYSACDASLGIGSGEGFGYPIFESIACGVPCVHGDYAGAAEFLPEDFKVQPSAFRGDGYYGLFRPVFNASQWAETVMEIQGTEAALDERLDWEVAWPRWAEWLKGGLYDAS